jgi:hypothetical protein
LSAGTEGFNRYQGPRIAELSSNEQAGVAGTGAQAGMYQPVVNMAMQAGTDMLGSNGGAPTQNQLNGFINPYVNYVLGNSLDRLQEQSDTNMTKIGSTAGMSGAFGGLRHGVLEGANLSELLKSARDLSGTTYSDAFDKGMGNWFKSQDNQRANIGTVMNTVGQGQRYNTQDIQNLMSTGLTERTRDQAGLDFMFSEFMREDQDDINKASFLSSIASQYPRDLFTKNTNTTTTTSESPLKTIAGIGLAAAGIMSGNPMAIAGLGAGSSALGKGTGFNSNADVGPGDWVVGPDGGNAKGGLIKKYAEGGVVKDDDLLLSAARSLLAKDPQYFNKVSSNKVGQDEVTGNLDFLYNIGRAGLESALPFAGQQSMPNTRGIVDPMKEIEKSREMLSAASRAKNYPAHYADGGMVKAGLAMAAGDDPLSAFEYMNPEDVHKHDLGFADGGRIPFGFMGLGSRIQDRRNGQNQQEASILPTAQSRQPFDWNTFLSQMNAESFTRPNRTSSVNPNYLQGLALPQTINTNYAPMANQPLNPDIPGPGGPQGLTGQTLQRPVAQDPINEPLSVYAGGGRVGPGERPGVDSRKFPDIKDDKSNWLAIQGILDMFKSAPPDSFESNLTDMDLDREEQLNSRSISELVRSIPFAAAKKKREHAAKKAAIENYDFGAPVGNRSPLDAMVADMLSEPQPSMRSLQVGQDGNLAEPINEAETRAVMNHMRAVEALDPRNPFPSFQKNNPVPEVERYTAEDDMRNFRERFPDATPLESPYIPYPYNPKGRKEYAKGGKVKAFQEGGPTFVEGGKSFTKSQDRVPGEGIDPLAALYYGMDSSAGTFRPDFKNLGRDDILAQTMGNARAGEGMITKAQARNQAPRFDTMSSVIDSLPMDPNTEVRAFTPTLPPTYSKSRMWDGVNEDVFIEGTKMNEQDNRSSVKDKNLSKNDADMTLAGTHAFTQFQYTPDTWNGIVKKIPADVRKQLDIRPVNKKDIYTYKSGDPELAKFLPSPEAAAYVYKNYYLPTSYETLKKAGMPITEMNLYLAHHLGPDGAVMAIPSLYDNADKPMRQILKDVGLTKAAKSKGNPWTKEPNLTFAQYRKTKEAAYEPFRAKYRGETIDEIIAKNKDKYPNYDKPNDPSRGGETIDGGTTTFNPIKIIGDMFTQGGKGFSAGGQVKGFAGGGRTGPDPIQQLLTMPENPKEYEPTWYEKFIERVHSPEGPFGKVDDFLYDNGLNFYPSNDGKRPAHQVVLPIDDKGWDYKPNPNLYMDPLGEWGNSGDPVDNFYNEMSGMIGQPGPASPDGALAPAPEMPPGGPGGGADDDSDPEVAMLKQLYRDRLKDYVGHQKPKKESVFGMFGDVNEPLLKLGLSILASKGSFGEALGEAGLASLEDRDKRQMKDQMEKSEKLKEALDMRYKNAMIESMDPSSKLKLQQAKSEYDAHIAQMKLDGAIERAGLSGDRSQENAILSALMKKRDADPDYVYKQNELEWLQQRGVPVSNPEDAGESLF